MDYVQEKILRRPNLLTTDELDAFEKQRPEGMSSAEIVDVFSSRGIKFSEATFRKYVQQGLLPRSRRVGQKGKHKGSKGIYPIGTIRQINEIKRMMSLDYTIEEIRQQFAFVGGEIEELRLLLDQIIEKLEESLQSGNGGTLATVSIAKQIDEARQSAQGLIVLLEQAARQIRDRAQIARSAV